MADDIAGKFYNQKFKLGKKNGTSVNLKIGTAVTTRGRENIVEGMVNKRKPIEMRIFPSVEPVDPIFSLTERGLLKKSKCPHIIHVRKCSYFSGYYVALWASPITNLSSLLEKRCVPRREGACRDIIGALSYCHQKGITLRKLTPETILLYRGCNYKISDFSSALPSCALDEDKKKDVLLASSILVAVLNNRNCEKLNVDKLIEFVFGTTFRLCIKAMRNLSPNHRITSKDALGLLSYEPLEMEMERDDLYIGREEGLDNDSYGSVLKTKLNYLILCKSCQDRELPEDVAQRNDTHKCPICGTVRLDQIEILLSSTDIAHQLFLMNELLQLNYPFNYASRETIERVETILHTAVSRFLQNNGKVGFQGVTVDFRSLNAAYGFLFGFEDAFSKKHRFLYLQNDDVEEACSIALHENSLKRHSRITEYWLDQFFKIYSAESISFSHAADFHTITNAYGKEAMRVIFPYLEQV